MLAKGWFPTLALFVGVWFARAGLLQMNDETGTFAASLRAQLELDPPVGDAVDIPGLSFPESGMPTLIVVLPECACNEDLLELIHRETSPSWRVAIVVLGSPDRTGDRAKVHAQKFKWLADPQFSVAGRLNACFVPRVYIPGQPVAPPMAPS